MLARIKSEIAYARGLVRALARTRPIAEARTTTLGDYLERWAKAHGDRLALLSETRVPHLPPARPARQSLRALGARPRAGQGRRDLPDGAQPAGLRGDLDGHGARRRRDGAHQRQARRAVARPFDRHRRRQGGDRRRPSLAAQFSSARPTSPRLRGSSSMARPSKARRASIARSRPSAAIRSRPASGRR